MKFEDVFNRAFARALDTAEMKEFNAGAIIVVEVEFKFSHKGESHRYSLRCDHIYPFMEKFGYRPGIRYELVRWMTSHTGEMVEFSENYPSLDLLVEMALKTFIPKERQEEIERGYVESLERFCKEMEFDNNMTRWS